MTMIMLVTFLLMLSALFVFALLNISSNSLSQSLTVSSTSNNYGNLLKLSASNFAASSLSKALSTLANYELVPSTRKANLISNSSLYLTYLIVNGTLPNDTSGYPQNAMGNLTLAIYNNSIANTINFASQAVSVNESRPLISQTDPYHLRVAYTERVLINASGNRYMYSVPVNVSLSLNNSPDLFYAQRGALRALKFASLSNITSVIGNNYAYAGNMSTYAYGGVYSVHSTASSSATCSGLTANGPTWLATQPISNSIIIATYNALNLNNCINAYGGLITYIANSVVPNVPYLIYPSSSNVLLSIPNDTSVLLYGPELATLNIEGLRSAIANSYYFASPYTPSYLDRAQAILSKQSPNGIFLFTNYDTQVANLPGPSGKKITINTPKAIVANAVALSVSAWIYSRTASGVNSNTVVSTSGACGYSLANNNNPYGYTFQVCNLGAYYSPNVIIGTGSWHLLTGVFNGTNSQVGLYEDGNLIGISTGPAKIAYTASPPTNIVIGEQASNGQAFNGLIANVQIYNNSLTAQQVQKLFAEGIMGLPVANNALVGWWPLAGDAHDYSGYNDNGSAIGVNFIAPLNYTRDSIFPSQTSNGLASLPGVFCNNNSQCASISRPQLYLGSMPLEIQGNIQQVADFIYNSINAYSESPNITTQNNIALSGNSFTLTNWFEFRTKCKSYSNGNGDEVLLSQNTQGRFIDPWAELYCSHANGKWQFVVSNTMGSTFNAMSNNVLLPNNWYFAALTYSFQTSIMNFYINGTLQASNTIVGLIGGNNALVVGSGENLFPGNMANVQYYNSSLGASQISQLYQEGIAGLPLPASIAGWWPLNGDARDYADGNNGQAFNVLYPYLSGNYYAPGLSSVSVATNEWQSLGLVHP